MITFFTAERDNNLLYEDNRVDVHYFETYHEAYEFAELSIKYDEYPNSYSIPTWSINKITFSSDIDYEKTELSVCCYDKYAEIWKWEHALDTIPNTALTSPWYEGDGLDAKFYEYSREVITPQTTTHCIYNILEERNNKAIEEKIGYEEFCYQTFQNHILKEIHRVEEILELDLSGEARKFYTGYITYLNVKLTNN